MELADAFDVRRTLRSDLQEGTVARIRALLAELGWSERQLAKRIGMTQAGMSRRFVGSSKWESTDLESVAKALDTSVERLVGASS